MKIKNYAKVHVTNWANYDNIRKICSIIDGNKNVTRKILFTMLKFGQKTNRVDLLANDVISYSKYIHGSLDGAFTNACKQYKTANNLPLYEAEGFFGSRMDDEPSASRYIKTKNKAYLEKIFRKEDSDILKKQSFEGFDIEPAFYVPVLPMLLIHGNLGTSPGFRQFIMKRNPRDIAENLFNYLDGLELNHMIPYYNNFKGEIVRTDKTKQYLFKGVIERSNTSTVVITELPLLSRKWGELKKNEKFLYSLKDAGKIVSFKSECNTKTDDFRYIIKFKREDLAKLDDARLRKLLAIDNVYTETTIGFDENNKMQSYSSINEILKAYCVVRLDRYKERKKSVINAMKRNILVNENKARFINEVLDDVICFKGKTTAQMSKILQDNKYDKVDRTYTYLLDITQGATTTDRIDSLKKSIGKLYIDLKAYQAIDIKDMWKNEINEIMIAIGEKKISENRKKAIVEVKPTTIEESKPQEEIDRDTHNIIRNKKVSYI